MMQRTDKRALETLSRLLQQQRQALREGRIRDLAAMVPEMEQALNTLPESGDPSEQAALRRLASDNAALLQSALAGVRQAMSMRASAAEVRLSTYDSSGRKFEQATGIGRTLSRQ